MRRRLLAAAATALAAIAVAIPASAALNHAATVSTNPVDYTPNVLDGEVRAFALVGDVVVVGGDFTTVVPAGKKAKLKRKNIFAYRATTGEILPFAPEADDVVLTLAAGPQQHRLRGRRVPEDRRRRAARDRPAQPRRRPPRPGLHRRDQLGRHAQPRARSARGCTPPARSPASAARSAPAWPASTPPAAGPTPRSTRSSPRRT